ncbi:MAG: glycosyltransferase, partial [Theionarchaea archaeon]|nr:glycosyltransferase [Theionarchaea archaeon]
MPHVSMFLANAYKPDPRVRREAISLVEAGHSVRIYAWDRDCRYPESEESDGIKVERIEVRGAYGKFLPLLPGFLTFYLRLILRSMKDGSDVIHCHDMDTLVPGVIVSRLTGRNLVYDMHESYPDFISTFAPWILVGVLRFVEPFLIRRAGLVITTSSMIGDIARRAGAKKVVPVMNCFDPFPPPGER